MDISFELSLQHRPSWTLKEALTTVSPWRYIHLVEMNVSITWRERSCHDLQWINLKQWKVEVFMKVKGEAKGKERKGREDKGKRVG